jgi:hypothetical protein
VRQVAGEIVGTKLIGGIPTVRFQILRPFGKRRPIARGEVRIAIRLRDGGDQQYEYCCNSIEPRFPLLLTPETDKREESLLDGTEALYWRGVFVDC